MDTRPPPVGEREPSGLRGRPYKSKRRWKGTPIYSVVSVGRRVPVCGDDPPPIVLDPVLDPTLNSFKV